MRAFFVLVFVLLMPVSAMSLDTSVDTGKTYKQDKEQSQSIRKSIEERDSSGKRKSKTTSKGTDHQTADIVKAIGQAMNQTAADVTLPLEAIFLDKIAELEASTDPFRTCNIATAPRLPQDFGFYGEQNDDVVNLTAIQNVQSFAHANTGISSIGDEKKVKDYRNCLAYYGAVIGQAYLYLSQDLDTVKAGVSKDKAGNVAVKGIGYDDFITIADAALKRALEGLENQTIRRIYDRAIKDNTACRFDRTVESIKCGSTLLTLGAIPKLAVGGIHVYGGQYMGYQGSYRISKSWSYQDAIERLKSTSRYSKFATEVSKYAEELESQGRTKEATMVRKKAWDIARTGKQAVSPASLLHNH